MPQEAPLPFERAVGVAGELMAIAERDLRLVRTVGDLERCLDAGPPGAVLHFEGAEPVDPALGNLQGWYERGLRSIGIVWSRPKRSATACRSASPERPTPDRD